MVLFRVRNTPARHGLTPYEILYGGPPPVTDLLDSAIDPLANTPGLQDRLKALQIIQCQIWKPLAAVYRPGDTTDPHPFQIGDSVYIRRHQSRTLEPHWKGPYTVRLTTPTALKVDGIAAWVHASHVKRAPSTSTADASQDGREEPPQWKLHRTQNPLKIRLSKIVQ
ncbi:Gag-Pol polyprotein (Fragment) [Vulpes lagopus]